MGKQSFFDKVREWASGIAFDVFLRLSSMTEEEFLAEHERRAVEQLRAADCPDCGGELQVLVRCVSCQHLQAVSR
jgi:hypothetical protein